MRLVRSLLVLVALLAPTAHAAFREAVPEVETYLARLEKLGFAGVVVVMEGDEPLLARGYGLADRERGIPWTPATVSTVGSITKQFTGAAILSLVNEGRISVDDSITVHLPDVPEDKRAITVHQLLTHSSGIVDLEGHGDWDPLDREEFVRLSLAQELAYPPGEGYEYSNAGYSLLGAILERITGTSYETFLRERFFLPLGMEDTGYILPGWGEDRIAHGYEGGEDWGTVLGRPMDEDGPYWVLRANGGIHSTAWDMVRWSRALLQGKAIDPGLRDGFLWHPFVDEGGGDSFYGYGWVVTDVGGARVITHNGGNTIFYADLALFPDSNLVVFLMTNVVSEMNVAGQVMNRVVEHLVTGDPLPATPDLAPPAGPLDPLAGTYRLAGAPGDAGLLRVSVDGEGLAIEAEDPLGFAALLSTRPLDPERSARFTARIASAVEASLAGDFSGFSEAYGGRATPERLASNWQSQLAEWDEDHGSLVDAEVLGTALRDGRDVTLVRYRFERGEEFRAYVWDPEAEATLLGVSRRGLDPVLHVVPVAGGGYATWDSRSGTSVPVDLDGTLFSLHAGSKVVAERR